MYIELLGNGAVAVQMFSRGFENNKPDSQNILKGNYTDRFIKGGQ